VERIAQLIVPTRAGWPKKKKRNKIAEHVHYTENVAKLLPLTLQLLHSEQWQKHGTSRQVLKSYVFVR